MNYDFDRVIDRKNSDSEKWDVKTGELPMWVADMDFAACPDIIAALEKRTAGGVFGYSLVPDEWYSAYIDWWKKRYNHELCKEQLIFTTGVIPAISSIVRKLTTPGEKVLCLTPVYNHFFTSIENNGRFTLECPLVYDGNTYSIDFDDLEAKLQDKQCSLMLLCNPHNPVGIIWDKGTLSRIGELCDRYDVKVVSDEIHCDITFGKKYVPFASVNETNKRISITCMSPSKSFNIAGFKSACVSVPDEKLFYRVWRGLNTDEVAEPNVFAVTTTVAAYTKGEQWLEQLIDYIGENKRITEEFIKSNIKEVKVYPGEATYLAWLDCTDLRRSDENLASYIRAKTGLYLSCGEQYRNGDMFLRMNLACPRLVVLDGLQRLKNGIEMYMGEKK